MKWLSRMQSRADRVIVVVMVSTGVLLPWVVAAGVKLHLEAMGKPTWPWAAFAAYAIPGVFVSAIAAAPLIGLAVVYQRWTLGVFLPQPPLVRRLVVLCTFGGCAVGMVRVFVDVFWEFDPLELLMMPFIVARYLPFMAAGLGAGALLGGIAGLVVRGRAGAGLPERDAGERGRLGPESQRRAGASPASAQDGAGGDVPGAELTREAASRASSLRNAVGTTMIAAGLAFAAAVAAPEGHFIPRFLDGLATVCFLWASWAILRGAWLLGTGWKVGFFVCWLLGLPLLVFALLVFIKLRRMSPAGGRGRPAGQGRPPHGPPPRFAEHRA